MSGRLLRDRSAAKPQVNTDVMNRALIDDYMNSNNSNFQQQQQQQQQPKLSNNFHNGSSMAMMNDQVVIARPINENNQFEAFQQDQQKLAYQRQKGTLVPFNYNGVPGVGVNSIDIIPRIHMALECEILQEVRWALTELAIISSHEPSLINLKNDPQLLEKLVGYYCGCPFINEKLDGKTGYPYLLQNVDKKIGLEMIENSVDAALVLRNLSQDGYNAYIISLNPILKQAAVKLLNCEIVKNALPIGDSYNSAIKILQYTIDLMESISSYISPAKKNDELFLSLMNLISQTIDRSFKISILRSLSRLMVRSKLSTKDEQFAADNVDSGLLDFVCSCLIMDTDPEIIVTGLDFLYQYILPGGVRITNLLKTLSRTNLLITVLPRLLTHGMSLENVSVNPTATAEPLRLIRRVKVPPPEVAKSLPTDLFQEINKLDEPQRATIWMRCCFKPSETSDVTQISLWKSYEGQFQKENKKLLPAVDFIKNVTNAFANSAAMVITNSETGQRKFIIKGIEPREEPVSPYIGNVEAANPKNKKPSDNLTEGQSVAQQKPVKFWNSSGNDAKSLVPSEISINAATLINGLVVHEKGKSLVKSMESDLLDIVLRVPKLYDQLGDTLCSIQQ
ncbi:Rsc9 protein [Saccharomycopsis crataegensis]|uniref:Rsc9 protein n=1 Tax=Saccharomycopsis crataegensis TaxID=43959 RepID=A0AAV5QJE3_9ASCO|nr:Rsc9 protein [Saccharomycopsis crataegensis]